MLWLLVVAVVVAAGSGGGSDDGPPAAVAPAQPGIGVGEDIWPLTGQGGNARHFAAGELNVGVYEALVTMGPDYSVRPGLAERWELVGPATWRFYLRPDVTWHDGRRFGADDVVWSWTGRDALLRSVSGTLQEVTKVDDLTVDFVSTRPNLRLPEQLVHPEGPVVPKDAHNGSLAIDRSRYVAEVLAGHGQPGRWMSPPAVPGPAAEAVSPPPIDPALSRQILDDAGWTTGVDGARTNGRRRLSLALIGGPAAPAPGLQWLAAMFRQVGVETSVRKAFDIRTGEQNRERGFDVELAVPNQNDANPAFLLATRTPPDPDYTARAAMAAAAASREDVQRAAAAMTSTLVNRDFSIVPVASVFHIYGARAGVDLAAPHPSAIHQNWVTVSTGR